MIIAIDTNRSEVQTSDVLTVEAAKKAMEILGYVVSQMTKLPVGIDPVDSNAPTIPRRPKQADFDFNDPEGVNAFLDQFNAARKREVEQWNI